MKKAIIILLVLLMVTGCGQSPAPEPTPGKDYDISKLSFEEFDELYGQMMYEGLPEDRTNLAVINASGTWRYNIKIRNNSFGGGMFDELGYAEMAVSTKSDPRVQIILHPRLVAEGDSTRERTDEEAGYQPFGGDFDENRKLKLTGNDCVLEIKRFYSWNGKEYLIGTMWFSEEESGDFMMIREQTSDDINNNDTDPLDQIIPYSEVIGNSKPFSNTPCEGITVSAEANAFYKDTEVKFTPVDDSMESFPAFEDNLFEQGYMTVGGWEVDAGLKDDETIPGQYDVTIDLATLDIDPSMYDSVRVLRINDEGEYYVYSSSLDGSRLSFSSNQNSVIVTTICLSIVAGLLVGAGIEYGISNKYYIWDRKFDPLKLGVETLHGKTEYGSYCIEWVMNDVDPNMAEKTARMAEIEQKYKKEAEEYRKVLNVFERFRTNYHVAEYYKKSLQADQEYQSLAKQLKVPEMIEYTAKCIETAFEYLGGRQRLFMPRSEIPFKIVYDGEAALGEAMNRTYSSAYVKVRPGNMKPGDQTDRDNYLLTITHELLHICQNRYRVPIDSLTNSTRFDEMVAAFMEREALAYYQYKGIITTEPPLTDSNYWGALRIPIETEPAGIKGKKLNDLMIHEGYNLGRLAMYLADRYPDKKVTTRNLLIARTYLGIPDSDIAKADIPSILCSAFGLTPKQFEECFVEWLISERKTVQEKMYDAFSSKEYKMPNQIIAEPGQKHYVKVDNDADYFLKIQAFIQRTTNMAQPCILVPDSDLASKYPEVTFLPAADYYPTSQGYFIPSFVNYNLKHDYLGIMEIHGMRKGNTPTGESGATLYVLDKTAKPVVVDDVENRKVIISFPEPSLAAKEKVIEGYCVYVLTTSGVNVKKFFEFKDGTFDRTIYLDYDDIADKNDPSNTVEITITLCEYATNTDNEKKLLGIESDPVNITVVPNAKQKASLKPYRGPIETGAPYNNPLMAVLGKFVETDEEHDYDYYLNRVYNYIPEKPVLDLKPNGDFTITYGGTEFTFDKFARAYNGGNISVDGYTISGHVTMGKSFRDMGINSDKVNTPFEWIADNLKMEPSSVSVTAAWTVQYWEYTRPQWCPSELYETYGIHEVEIPKEGGGTRKAWWYFNNKSWYENMQYTQNGMLHVTWNEAENRYDFVLSEYLDMSTRYYSDEELVTNTGECKDWSLDNFKTYGYFNGEKPD